MGRIFISHRNTPTDNAWAVKIHGWIKDQKGIRGFLDFDIQDGLQIGTKWEDEIYAAMHAAQVVIAVVSDDWLRSDWCLSEARMARLLGRKLILIMTEDCPVPFGDTQSIFVTKHGEAHAFEQLREALRTTHKLPDRPYPGLVSFEEQDAAIFFGREDETRALENQIDSLFLGRPETARLLLLLGASGSGKSSLMRAGVIPRFKSDTKHFCLDPITPRGDPLGELAFALDLDLDDIDAEAAAKLILAEIKKRAPTYQRALLPIDQAEELLRGDHTHFFNVLRAVLDKGRGRIIALATMRSDFLNSFQQSGLVGTGTPMPYDTFTLDPLPRDCLVDIIQKPAGLYDVTFEEGLIARIIQDQGGPDALPLLAFFLSEFWRPEYIKDGILQVPEYENFGGIDMALKKAVERALRSCKTVEPDESRLHDALQEVFLGRLVSVRSGSGEAVRNRAPARSLKPEQTALLQKFAHERLLIERDGTWEVVHEALLRQWAELEDWIDAAREDLVAIDRIQAATAHWDASGQQNADLTHAGNRLYEAMRLQSAPRYADRFTDRETAYLKACSDKENDILKRDKLLREEAERERDQAEIEARRAVKNQSLGLVALSVSELQAGRTTDAVMLAMAAWPRRADPADDLMDYAVALDALEAACIAQREVLRIEDDACYSSFVAYSPDGTRIISSGEDAILRFWDASSGAHVAASAPGPLQYAANISFSRCASRIAVVDYESTLRIWDTSTGDAIGKPLLSGDPLDQVFAFSPDATLIARASSHNTLHLWDVSSGDRVGEPMLGGSHDVIGLPSQPMCIAFSPDGTKIVCGSDDWMLRLWDIATGTMVVQPIKGHTAPVVSVAFSPDGAQIVSGGEDNTVMVWNAHTGELAKPPMTGHDRWVTSVAFSPDGTRIVSGSADQTLRLWDVVTGDAIGPPLAGHDRPISSVAFSPDGTRVVSASKEDALRVWTARAGEPKGPALAGHKHVVNSVAFSPDGTQILSGSYDGTLRLWRTETSAPISSLKPARLADVTSIAFSQHGTRLDTGYDTFTGLAVRAVTGDQINEPERLAVDVIFCVAFSPDGTRFVSANDDGTLRFWDAHTGEATGDAIVAHTDRIASIAFSPDGSQIASGSLDSTLKLWDATDGTLIRAMKTFGDSWIYAVAFSPDGTQIISGSMDKAVRRWDAMTGYQVGDHMVAHYYSVNSVAVSPDGSLIVSGSSDRTLQMWDAHTGDAIGAPMAQHEDAVTSVVFSPDGTRMASASKDRTIGLWDVATRRCLTRFSGHHSDVNSVAFSPDSTHILSGHRDGVLRIWAIPDEPGTLFDVAAKRLPTRTWPSILSKYGIVINDPICTGQEPLPPRQKPAKTAPLMSFPTAPSEMAPPPPQQFRELPAFFDQNDGSDPDWLSPDNWDPMPPIETRPPAEPFSGLEFPDDPFANPVTPFDKPKDDRDQ